MESLKKYVAEVIGTFVLVFFGCGTAVVAKCSTDNYAGYALTALAFGLGPAIFVGGDALKNVWVFILAPLVGGALAAICHKFLNGKED